MSRVSRAESDASKGRKIVTGGKKIGEYDIRCPDLIEITVIEVLS